MAQSAVHQFLSGLLKGLGIVFILAAVLVVTVSWVRHTNAQNEARLEARISHLRPLEVELYAMVTGQRTSVGATKLAPGVILLTVAMNRNSLLEGKRYSGTIDPLTLELPQSIFPAAPENVRTVVTLAWSEEVVGEYEVSANKSRQEACIEKCDVEIWDVETRALVDAKSFIGGEPPRAVPDSYTASAVYGTGCDAEILQFVESLFAN